MLNSTVGTYLNVYEEQPLGYGIDIYVIINEANAIAPDDPVIHEVESVVAEYAKEHYQTFNALELEMQLEELLPFGVSVIKRR